MFSKTKLRNPNLNKGEVICDNGPEFICYKYKSWAERNKVELSFIIKGKPSDNAFIESFNSRYRKEFLNTNHLDSVVDAQRKTDKWIVY